MTAKQDRNSKIRVGIIGANPDRGWAAEAHIPALKSLPNDFEITALSTTRRASADAASKQFGIPNAFDNHHDLVTSPDVDVVAVTVKVPHHLELATAALEAGKDVYCEWPLGNGLAEAQTLAALAKKQGVLAVAGLQARSAPSVAYVRDLVNEGFVGEVLSTTMVGSGMGWGPTVPTFNAYLNDKRNGATMLSIPFGHAADALCHCLGEMRELSATMTQRRKSFTIAGSAERRPMTSEDQVAVTGLLEGGAALSIHYRGGVSRGTNLLWEINGTEGDLQLTADGGHAQIFEMTVRGGRGAQKGLEVMPVPDQYRLSSLQGSGTNVAHAYARFARDFRDGSHLCPTFDDAVRRHSMLDAIETAAATGQRQTLGVSHGAATVRDSARA
jgi:predicted dehydrogenase